MSAGFTVGKWQFRENFDSGNLGRVEAATPPEPQIDAAFDVWTRPDCAGTEFENTCRSWFYFGITGGRPGEQIMITVKNLNNQTRLFEYDMRPVVRSMPLRPRFARLKTPAHYRLVGSLFEMRFRYEWEHEGGEVFFALTYPAPYEDTLAEMARLQAQWEPANSTLYFKREHLTNSAEGRRVDLLTITSHEGVTDAREPYIDGLFPDRTVERPHVFTGKKVFLATARVHPGETPATHMFEGFLRFILREDDPRAIALRRMFVFKLIPILNPDGVVRGHFRSDTFGENLNRVYGSPARDVHPTIFAAKALALAAHAGPGLGFYIDFHGHATKRGCFVFGNALTVESDMVDNIAYARIMTVHTPHFDYEGSNFTEENMCAIDRATGQSREGSSRVVLYQATGLVHCYTLEANYNSTRGAHPIPAATGEGSGRASPPRPRRVAGRLNPEAWADVGRAAAVSVLELFEANPWSRLPESQYRSLAGIKTSVQAMAKRCLASGKGLGKAGAKKDDEGGIEPSGTGLISLYPDPPWLCGLKNAPGAPSLPKPRATPVARPVLREHAPPTQLPAPAATASKRQVLPALGPKKGSS